MVKKKEVVEEKSKKIKTTKNSSVEKNSKNVSKKNIKQKKEYVQPQVELQSASDELRKLSIILISIVGIICVFYIITVFVTKNSQGLNYQINDSISQISYTDILASDILKKDGSYYVLVKEDDDKYISLYDKYISSYITKENHLKFYYVNLNDALNKKYKAEENNFDISNLKFKGTTLLKIANGNIESTYSDNSGINEHLKALVNEYESFDSFFVKY